MVKGYPGYFPSYEIGLGGRKGEVQVDPVLLLAANEYLPSQVIAHLPSTSALELTVVGRWGALRLWGFFFELPIFLN